MNELRLPDGNDLKSASFTQPFLFVFVRHKGCTFCREALSDLAKFKKQLLQKNVRVVIVHMGPESTSEELAKTYNLHEMEFLSDPERRFYKAFELKRGNFMQLFGPKIWLRGFKAGVLQKHGVGLLEGDGLQLGGICLYQEGRMTKLHDPCDASDIGDWNSILKQLPDAKKTDPKN